MEESYIRVKETINGYERLLNIIEQHQGNDGICRLSKKKISSLFGISYTGTLKKLNFLMKYGLIEQDGGGFTRTEKDVILHTPLSLIIRILLLVSKRPDVFSSFKQQAELLGETYENVQTAWGFHGYFFGSKYPNDNQMEVLKENGLK
ncbi:TPA: hypothetical protein G9C53_004983 [Salmonella enterica subsp. enterica serovar Typhimurium var. 5-]|uniref:Uncharacterized protein n=1 Tax=Salmonella enterica subsp. enterica serovar Typhimurium var. 5- TaxID=1620419 RepID=A0A740TVR3_SALTM|nr:hypothetical protein [Salmonella enterica subsp. enterica serovar Typhimurium var. 5-]